MRADAAAWVVRLQAHADGAGAGEADWLAFEAWLAQTPGARAAFDAAMSVWLLADQAPSADFAADLGADTNKDGRARRGPSPWGGAALSLGGFGAVMAAMLVLGAPHGPALAPHSSPAAPPPQLYAAAPGLPRTVMLADGTRMDLRGGSQVLVSLDARGRRVKMNDGEVAFAVVHDAARPFTVAVGDRLVRDVGTEFDVRRDGPEIRVTVREGQVEVGAKDNVGAAVTLGAGRQLVHDETTGASSVSAVSADEAFAWKQGRLIYRDQPLRVVVDDLNRRFPHAVRIEGERAAALRFTGVLSADGEDATIRRLTALLPLEADHVGDATVLKAREEPR